MNYQEFYRKAHTDEGCALFYKVGTDTKYHILIPLDTIPSFSGDVEEIDYGYTTMASNGVLKGRKSLNSSETDFYWVRDFTNKLKDLKGKLLEFLIVLPDYQGYRLRGEIDYDYNEISRNDSVTGTLTITPSWKEDTHIDDVSDLIQETATIEDIDPIVELSLTENSAGKTLNIPTDPVSGVTATIRYGSLSYFGTDESAVAGVTFTPASGNDAKATLKIMPKTKGREIVKITTSATDYASWDTYITVIVKA